MQTSKCCIMGNVMKHIRKTVVTSLILALASFAGSFCLHPLFAQAAGESLGMAGMDMSASSAEMIGIVADMSDEVSFSESVSDNALNICPLNCVGTIPKAALAKKTSVDAIPQIATIVSDEALFFPVFSSGSTDLSGTDPPAPDILSSVFKKE